MTKKLILDMDFHAIVYLRIYLPVHMGKAKLTRKLDGKYRHMTDKVKPIHIPMEGIYNYIVIYT